jgi:Domain of unknown function (DUF4410)
MARPKNGTLAHQFGWRAAGRLAWLMALTLAGCTSVDSAADRQIAEQRLPRPAMIVVHDFAVAPEEVQPGRSLSGARLVQDTGRTEREKAVGHAFAEEFTAALVEEIRTLGLPAQRADAPNLPSGDVVTIEGQFISLAGGPSQPGIVGFSGGWPDVLADVQLYGTDSSGEELSEEIEVSVSQVGGTYPAALLPDPTITVGQVVTTPGISPQIRAKLETSAKEAAGTVAGQLKPYFAGQGWIPRAPI